MRVIKNKVQGKSAKSREEKMQKYKKGGKGTGGISGSQSQKLKYKGKKADTRRQWV